MRAIDLQQFCSKDDVRLYLMKPWRRGPFTYATNGHIIVRVDAVDGDEEEPRAPDAAEIFFSQQSDSALVFAPLRVNLPPITTDNACETCGGAGHWKDCTFQGTDIFMDCRDCGGNGTIEKQVSVSIAGVHFSARYIAQIGALPGAEFLSNPADAIIPCPFRFAGGTGLLMPMRGRGKDGDLGDIDQYRIAQ